MEITDLISEVRSGVAQIYFEKDREPIGGGTAFLINEGLVTNSHVIHPQGNIDTIIIRFEDSDPNNPIRVSSTDIYNSIAVESSEDDKDYVFLRFWEPEFNNRYLFDFSDSLQLSVGEKIVFLGFPFRMLQLTSHVGYVASIHERNNIRIIQIDGSVNGGNSGGPLLDLKTGKVAGIVTRTVTGFIANQFDQLINALRQNQIALGSSRVTMSVDGINPIQALRASQAAMERIAINLRRSANVGIGYAYSAEYIRNALTNLQ
jgi:S1-C subfamily serine protease